MGKNNNTAGKLGVIGLAAIVISSMIGGGIFSLPQNMAQGASVGVILIAWLITGIGMYFIANTFSILSEVKPNLTSGIYMYARDGFGPFTGFTIGWGYWLSQIFGNVGYAVITMDALNYFFPPHFAGGNNLLSIFCGSLLIWFFNFVVLRGVKQAAIMNIMGTIGKLVPLAIFIILLVFAFNMDKFNYDFWGHLRTDNLGSFGCQLKSTMLVTLWAFIGIEGAVVLSNRAKNQNEVSKATFLGFIGCLIIYVLLSVLPFGFMDQQEIAKIANPSTAGILEKLVGPWGSWLMNIGLLIAVLFSWLAWTMISAEIPFAAAKNGTFPRQFAKENKNGAPSFSLWVTSAVMQLAILMVYFSNNAWNTMLSITGVMVLPAYIASTMYLWKLTRNGEYEKIKKQGKMLAVMTGILGSLYGFWLIYAAGLKYLFMAFIFLAIGIPVFMIARKQSADGKPCFSEKEKGSVVFILAVAISAIIAFAGGWLKI